RTDGTEARWAAERLHPFVVFFPSPPGIRAVAEARSGQRRDCKIGKGNGERSAQGPGDKQAPNRDSSETPGEIRQDQGEPRRDRRTVLGNRGRAPAHSRPV